MYERYRQLDVCCHKDNDFEQSLGHPYFDLDIDHRLKNNACYRAITDVNPKNITLL